MSSYIRFGNWLVVLLLLTLEPVHTFLHGNLEAASYLHCVSSTKVAPMQLQEAPEVEPEHELSHQECLLCKGLLTLYASVALPLFSDVSPDAVQAFNSLIFHPGIPHTLSDARAPPTNS